MFCKQTADLYLWRYGKWSRTSASKNCICQIKTLLKYFRRPPRIWGWLFHQPGVKCNECGKQFVNERNLKRHNDTVHEKNSGKVECKYCLNSYVNILIHLKKKTNCMKNYVKNNEYDTLEKNCKKKSELRRKKKSELRRNLKSHLVGEPINLKCQIHGNRWWCRKTMRANS